MKALVSFLGMFFVTASLTAGEVVRLDVFPPAVSLETRQDHQSLVIQAIEADGLTRDVSRDAKLSLADATRVKLDQFTLRPLADGKTTLQVEYAGKRVSVPVEVRAATTERPISFKLDVMPVFTRAGCNGGKCHGAAAGKDGFRLSLFGYDPDGDYERLTREHPGRRIHLARPNECLLMTKAMGEVAHTGGQKIFPNTPMHATLIEWIKAGAPRDPATLAKPIGLEVYPKEMVLAGKGARHRITVRARYSDGTDRDVTGLCLFLGNNDGAATVDEDGVITSVGRGESFVIARFATFTEGARVIVRPEGSFTFPKLPEANYIDTLIHAKLKKMHILPSELCSDAVFIRRVYIDLIGLLPTPAEIEKFVSNTDPNKREKLVDQLLARKEFTELWILKWSELLQIRSINGVSPKGIQLYHEWLKSRLEAGTPLDLLVKEILATTGGTFTKPATNYYQTETTPITIAENVAQVFLGMRIQCAQCHNHPFDRWTMDDYYGFTAFFSQIGYKQAQDPREITIFNKGEGEIRHPVDQRIVLPKYLGGAVAKLDGRDYREVLVDWLASPENPFFAQNLANIAWAHFFGKGIVDAVDDVRVSNPPSNPELLEALGKKFVEYRFDVKKLARDICLSHAYQRSTQRNPSNELDDRNFSRGAIRRIRAEVLLDCIAQVTETKNKFPGLPEGARAVSLLDGRISNYFLTTFGRGTRETPCSCEVKVEPTLSQALHLINGETVSDRVVQGKVVTKLLATHNQSLSVVDELYLRCFGRKPSSTERQRIESALKDSKDVVRDLEDLFWALLNSKEFVFNH